MVCNFTRNLFIFFAIRPGILSGCKMMNKTWDSLHIVCRMTGANVGTAMGLAEVNIENIGDMK